MVCFFLYQRSNRMRGSAIANRISEINVPTTVKALSNKIKLPARYISCEVNARNSKGPVVSRFSTTETSVNPEIKLASDQPTVLKNGLSATRTGYFQINFP